MTAAVALYALRTDLPLDSLLSDRSLLSGRSALALFAALALRPHRALRTGIALGTGGTAISLRADRARITAHALKPDKAGISFLVRHRRAPPAGRAVP